MRKYIIPIFSGTGIGLLIGVLMGLAVSPTVGVIIGALASSLALILGLNDKFNSNEKSARIGAFGFACVFGALFGIFVRTNNVLSPGLKELKQEYLELGYTEDQALAFISYKEFGILDKSWKMSGGFFAVEEEAAEGAPENNTEEEEAEESSNEDKKEASGKEENEKTEEKTSADPKQSKVQYVASLTEKQHKSVLFSADVGLDVCESLEGTSMDIGADEVIFNFELEGGFWEKLANTSKKDLGNEETAKLLLLTRDCFCGNNSKDNKKQLDTGCPEIMKNLSKKNLSSMYKKQKGLWICLEKGVNSQVNPPNKALQILGQSLCED